MWHNDTGLTLFIADFEGPLTRYVKLRVSHAPGTFPNHQLQRKPLVSDPGMHHGMCVTRAVMHIEIGNPWCLRKQQFYISGKRPI